MPVSWPGFVDTRGRLHLDARVRFDAYLRVALLGKRVDVTVVEHGEKRSVAQNNWLWGVCYPAIADHCGYDFHEHETLHYDLLAVRFGTVTVTPLIPGVAPRTKPARTSSELSTKEFADYMEWLVRFAAEHFDVVVPLPDEAVTDERKADAR
jgi:hypothetical protein